MDPGNNIKVSFIIPALNSESTLRECLSSIFAQAIEKGKIEVLLVDNGSTDNTVSIGKEKGAIVLEGPGLTVAALRNLGARNSHGDILAFVDSDCVISTDWLRNALPLFDDPTTGAAGANTTVSEYGTWVQKTWYIHRGNRRSREYVEWLPTENLLVRRDIFLAIGGFNENLVTCEDVDLCYRIGKSHKIVCDSTIAAVHLGEARTIRHFFKKERWRGRGNLKGFFHHGFNIREIPSLILPFYGVFIVVVFILALYNAIIYTDNKLSIASVIIMVIPQILLSVYKNIKSGSLKWIFPLALLYSVYISARTISAFSRS